jgi:hypothetical protein
VASNQGHREFGERFVVTAEAQVGVPQILVRVGVVWMNVDPAGVRVDGCVEILPGRAHGAHALVDAVQPQQRMECDRRLELTKRFLVVALALIQTAEHVVRTA